MKEKEYPKIYQIEDTYWWYQGTHSLIMNSIKKRLSAKNPKICDIGCGTGGLLQKLIKEGFPNSYGFDVSPYAFQQLKKREKLSGVVWRGNVEQLALHDSSFDAITCIDVLCHSSVHKEEEALKEFFRILKPSGIFILQLPAFEFLKGTHSIAVQTRKRYRIGEVERYVKEAGFKIEFCSYRNTWFFPILLVWRMFSRLGVGGKKSNSSTDMTKLPEGINTLLYILTKIENSLLTKFRFLLGVSIFCIARKE